MYSIKMQSSNNNHHISGAETLCKESELESYIKKFFNKGFYHQNGEIDFLNLKIEMPILKINSLPVYDKFKAELNDLAARSNVSSISLAKGLEYIYNKQNYRGAIILSSQSGERVDKTGNKGIRVTNFGISDVEKKSYMSERVQDAVAIASCINNFKGVKGELCVSDDLSYTTGYFANPFSYNRLYNMKEDNTRYGGRVIFVDEHIIDINQYVHYLQKVAKQVVL